MFSSIFSSKLFAYFASPKIYIVNLKIKIDEKLTWEQVEVVARSKYEAGVLAEEMIKERIKIIVIGVKSKGKVKKFSEF